MISAEFTRNAAFASGVVLLSANPTQAHYSDLTEYIRTKHASFLEVMMSDCCYGHEVVHNVKQVLNPDGGYSVIIPAGSYPDQKETKVVVFTSGQVKTREQIESSCKLLYATDPAKTKTCAPVPMEMNIVFVNPENFGTYCILPKFDLG